MNSPQRPLPRLSTESSLLNRLFKDIQRTLRKDPIDQSRGSRGEPSIISRINTTLQGRRSR